MSLGNSSGSNLGPTSKRRLVDRVKGRYGETGRREPERARFRVDLVTTSASGLDPDITPAGALFQVPRVAKARGLRRRMPCGGWWKITPPAASLASSVNRTSTCCGSISRWTRWARVEASALLLFLGQAAGGSAFGRSHVSTTSRSDPADTGSCPLAAARRPRALPRVAPVPAGQRFGAGFQARKIIETRPGMGADFWRGAGRTMTADRSRVAVDG